VTEACLTAESKCHCDDRAAREAGQLRARDGILLNQLIGVVAAPLDCHEALRQVARLLVPQLADLAVIDILADDGTPQRVAVSHATDPAIATLLHRTACDLRDGTYAPTLTVLRSGSPYLQEECDQVGFELFLASAELTDDQKEVLRSLQPRSYMSVPLTIRGRCVGVITLLYTALSGRRYHGGNQSWAQQLAGRIAAALEIARLEKVARKACARQEQLGIERERGRALENAMVDTASGPIVVVDALGRIQRFNPVAQKLSGYAANDALGLTFWQMVPGGEVAAVRATLDAIHSDGRPREDSFQWLNRAGSRRLVRWSFTPLLGSDHEVAYVVAVGDITDDVARQAAAGAAADRLAQVHALTVALSSAHTPEQVAHTVLAQALAALGASAGMVMICSQDGLSLEALGTTGYPEDTVEASVPLSMPVPLMTAVRTGDVVLLRSPEESLRAGYAQRADHLQLGHAAWAALPLKTRGRVIGALGLSFDGPRVFSEDERGLLLVLAAQCAQAIERAQLDATLVQEPAANTFGGVLSAREREVLGLVAQGFTNREIAERLSVATGTIKTHVDHVGDKLGVSGSSRSRVLTAVRAIQLGLVSISPTWGIIPRVGDATWPTLLPSISHVGDGGVWPEA
jgi:PAS domain S-box-containing protein